MASASVLAKVERDRIMVGLAADHAAYAWELNKGYAAPEHLDALREHGPCALHRRSWRLPGTALDDGPWGEPGAVVVDGPDMVTLTAAPPTTELDTHER